VEKGAGRNMASGSTENTTAYRPSRIGTALALVFLLLLSFCGYAYARYYAQESRKGVATASGLYFSSNCMQSVEEIDKQEDFPSYVDSNGWNGEGSCTVQILVQNYENVLLYNDANLNITYDIKFCLIDAPADSTYTVINKEQSSETSYTLEKGTTVCFSNQYLQGGSAQKNQIDLIVSPPSGYDPQTYVSGRVAVWAEPSAPDYVKGMNLAACIQVKPDREYSVTGGFDIAEKLSKEGTNVAEMLKSLSGFAYTVRTTGDLQGSTGHIQLRWNSTYLEMDLYNSYYLAAQKAGLVQTEGEYTTLTMDAYTYASMNFSFYKTAAFDVSNFQTASAFTRLVDVTYVGETAE
jgi:hypothetical protein